MTAVATEHVNHFDILEMVCDRKGWAALLRSTGTKDGPRIGAPATELTYLDIVELGDEHDLTDDRRTRRRRILAGELVVRVQFVYGPCALETAAMEALDVLGQRGLVDWNRAT